LLFLLFGFCDGLLGAACRKSEAATSFCFGVERGLRNSFYRGILQVTSQTSQTPYASLPNVQAGAAWRNVALLAFVVLA